MLASLLIVQLVLFTLSIRRAIRQTEPRALTLTILWAIPSVLALHFVLTH